MGMGMTAAGAAVAVKFRATFAAGGEATARPPTISSSSCASVRAKTDSVNSTAGVTSAMGGGSRSARTGASSCGVGFGAAAGAGAVGGTAAGSGSIDNFSSDWAKMKLSEAG